MKRFKVYNQLEFSDCGVACIRMIARHYGKRISPRVLRTLFDVGKGGVSVGDLKKAFSRLGMDSAAVSVNVEDLLRMPLPAILYWRQRHFVVLYHIDVKRKIFYIADPEMGKLKFSEAEFSRYWKGENNRGVAVMAEPGDDWDKYRFESYSIFSGLYSLIKREIVSRKGDFLKIMLLSLICMGADLLVPLMMQTTVDKGIGARDIGLVWMLVAAQFAVYFGNALASNGVQYLMLKLGLRMNLEMTSSYLRKLIRRPLSFFDRKSSAELIQKTDDQKRIKDFLMTLPQSTFFVLINMIVFSGLMIWYNLWIFLIFLLLTLFEIGWTLIFLGPRRGVDYSLFTCMAENRNQVYELVNGMAEIKSGNAQRSRVESWEDMQRKVNSLSMRSTLISMGMGGGQSLIARLKEFVLTGICATLVIKGNLTFGEMLTVSYLVGRLSGPFHNIISMIGQLQDAGVSYERLEDVTADDEETGTAEATGNEIIFDNVSFKYPGSESPFVIKNLSLAVPDGKRVAIVGESGCGKTTLIKLMLGFYLPQQGTLKLGGVEVRQLDRDSWLSKCAVVMQSGYIFSDSIAANVAISDKEFDLERVREVCGYVGLSDFIARLPMGYSTRIGATGLELSGGQKQRLLIARAIYQQPEIMFLDEATSSLDATNEARITAKLLELQKGKTMIVAAHRLSTVRNADQILFMKDGQIIEQGTHDQLIAKKGEYRRLVENQLEIADS